MEKLSLPVTGWNTWKSQLCTHLGIRIKLTLLVKIKLTLLVGVYVIWPHEEAWEILDHPSSTVR